MSLGANIKSEIADLLLTAVREKLAKYEPETGYMPFHHRLLGKDRYAMFSFVHSMNTTFGMSIWEQIAVILAKAAGNHAERQYKLLGDVDSKTEELIRNIETSLRRSQTPASVDQATSQIRASIQMVKGRIDPDSTVDLFVRVGKTEYYFDITSAKPNMKDFVGLKLKLLRWIALRLSQDNNIQVFTKLAIPYNPYYPEPYERWTLKGLFDLSAREVLVGEEFWNFVAGTNVYDDLLGVFQSAGEILRPDIDRKFAEFR